METVDEHENSKKEKEYEQNEQNEQVLMCMRQDEHALWVQKQNREKRKIVLLQILLLTSLLCFWEIAAQFGWIDTFLFSSPSAIVKIFWQYFSSGSIWTHIGITMWETFAGFCIGTVCGIGIAILLWWYPMLSKVLDPFLVVMNALPKTALAPIVIVWFGAGLGGIIAVAVSISIVVTILSAYGDFKAVDSDKIRMLQSFGATKGQILLKLILPGNRENLLSIAKINMGLCLIGVIVGEFLVSRCGIGYLIVYGYPTSRFQYRLYALLRTARHLQTRRSTSSKTLFAFLPYRL